MTMGKIIDDAIAIRLMYLLLQPVEKTDAFKLGIVDKKGKQLIPTKDLTQEEKNSFSYLQRLVMKIKSVLGNTIPSVAAVIAMLKEDVEVDDINEAYALKMNKLYEDAPATAIGNVSGLSNEAFKGKKSPLLTPYMRRNINVKMKRIEDVGNN